MSGPASDPRNQPGVKGWGRGSPAETVQVPREGRRWTSAKAVLCAEFVDATERKKSQELGKIVEK